MINADYKQKKRRDKPRQLFLPIAFIFIWGYDFLNLDKAGENLRIAPAENILREKTRRN